MKILLVSQSFYPEIGSQANRMNNFAVGLEKLGHKIDVLTSEPSYPNKDMYKEKKYWTERSKEFSSSGIKVERVKSSPKKRSGNKFKRLFYYFEFIFRSMNFVRNNGNKYEMVICTSPQLFTGLIGVYAKYKWNVKFIFDVRDLWPESVKGIGVYKESSIILKLAYNLERFILKRANKIIINSPPFLKYMEKRQMEKKCEYVPNGITKSEEEKEKYKYNTDKKLRLIYSGNIGLAQDLIQLLYVSEKLKGYKDIEFTIVGTGAEFDKIRSYVDEEKLSNVVLKGMLPKNEVLQELLHHDIAIVYLKDAEVFETVIPGKILDYMNIGIPIVGGANGECKKIINDGQCGKVVSPREHDKLVDVILDLYSNKNLLKKMSSNAREYVRKNFLWEDSLNKLDYIIKNI